MAQNSTPNKYLSDAAEHSLSSMFDGDLQQKLIDVISVPAIQRIYAYKDGETTSLVSALVRAYLHRTSQPTYCMGTIVLCKEGNGDKHYDIIDGQQRLATMTILLAKVAQLSVDSQIKTEVHTLLIRSNMSAEAMGIGALKYRLDLGYHGGAHQFEFARYVQNINGLELLSGHASNFGNTKIENFLRRINSNADIIGDLLSDIPPQE